MVRGATLKRPVESQAALLSPGSPKRRCALCPGPLPFPKQTPPPTLPQPPAPGSERRLPTPEQIFQNIKQEYSRYQKWRHLEVVLHQSEACSSESQPHATALTAPSSPGSSWMKKDQPNFTLPQVGILCERLLKDFEDKIQEEYEQILNTKLAEQYEAFVKFTHDQIMCSDMGQGQQAMYPEAFLPIWVPGLTSRDGCCTLFATGLISHFSSNFAS